VCSFRRPEVCNLRWPVTAGERRRPPPRTGGARAGSDAPSPRSAPRRPGAARPRADRAARRCDERVHARSFRRARHGRREPASDRRVPRTPRTSKGGVRGPRGPLRPAPRPGGQADPDDHRHGAGEAGRRGDPGEFAAGEGPGRADVSTSAAQDRLVNGCAWRG